MNLQQLYELRRAAEQIGTGIKRIPRGKRRREVGEAGRITYAARANAIKGRVAG
jgi:hypothetical protein